MRMRVHAHAHDDHHAATDGRSRSCYHNDFGYDDALGPSSPGDDSLGARLNHRGPPCLKGTARKFYAGVNDPVTFGWLGRLQSTEAIPVPCRRLLAWTPTGGPGAFGAR
jgi:hypothetical protein